MPDYKKKKHSRFFGAPAKASKKRMRKNQGEEKIVMSPKESSPKYEKKPDDMRVLRGKRLEQKRNAKIGICIIGLVLAVVLIIQLLLPVGIIDTVSNSLTLMGAGSYPIELSSTSTQDAVSRGYYYYVLTADGVTAYSNSGKELFSYTHGFEFPVIKTSDSRALVFNQGGNEVLIFDLKGLRETVKTENAVITAAVSDSGKFAIATQSEKYTSELRVYDKRGSKLYEWFSAEEIINNIALSPNGRKIAVSTFNSANGIFNSTVSVLNFKSAAPEHKIQFSDTLIYSLDTTHPLYFAVVTDNSVKFLKWSDAQKSRDHSDEYSTAFFRGGKGGFVAVFNRESNKTDNRIALFSKNGKLINEIEFNGIISDIQVSGGHIYCISDTDIYLISKEGEVLRTASCGFGTVKFSITSENTVAVISDSTVEKIKLEGENEK